MATNMNEFVSNSSCGSSSEEELEMIEPVRVGDFSTRTWKEDLTLNIGGKQLYVSSGVLAVISPVLSSMIEQIFSVGKGSRALDLPGSHDDFVEFLRCIYPNVMKAVTKANALKIAPLAHHYEVETIKSMCKEVLVEMVWRASLNDLCAILTCATACQFSSLKKKCLDEMAKHDDHVFDEAMTNLQLTPDDRLEIEKGKVATLQTKVEHLNVSIQEKTRTCKEFEILVRAIWLKDLEIKNKKSVEIRIIRVEVSENIKTAPESITFWNVAWKVRATYTKTIPDVYLTAVGDASWKEWTCKVKVRCSMTDGVSRYTSGNSQDMGSSCKQRTLTPYRGYLQSDFDPKATQQVSVIFAVGDLLV